jgi:hypothetical protein
LESEAEKISPSTPVTHSKSRFKLLTLIVFLAVCVVVGAFLVSAFVSPPQEQDAWPFIGAYARYEGSAKVDSEDFGMLAMSIEIDFAVRLEIVDFNSTHALVTTSFEMTSSVSSLFGVMDGESVDEENSMWVPITQIGILNAFEEVNLVNSYEQTVEIAGFGKRACIIYEYEISDVYLKISVYVDKNIGWPLKMTISIDETELGLDLDLDINLTETNIPSLK